MCVAVCSESKADQGSPALARLGAHSALPPLLQEQ